MWPLRAFIIPRCMRVQMQSKGGEGTAAEDAAVTSEETKPTEAETEVRGVAEPAPRLKNTSFFEEIRRALAEAKKDPTVTPDLLNDIRALQPTGRAGRQIVKVQASKHRVHPCIVSDGRCNAPCARRADEV